MARRLRDTILKSCNITDESIANFAYNLPFAEDDEAINHIFWRKTKLLTNGKPVRVVGQILPYLAG